VILHEFPAIDSDGCSDYKAEFEPGDPRSGVPLTEPIPIS
jgi:hypothetical protein